MFSACATGEIAADDPWDGATLEWSIPSPPPVYNFARIPTVHSRDAWWAMKHPERMHLDPIEVTPLAGGPGARDRARRTTWCNAAPSTRRRRSSTCRRRRTGRCCRASVCSSMASGLLVARLLRTGRHARSLPDRRPAAADRRHLRLVVRARLAESERRAQQMAHAVPVVVDSRPRRAHRQPRAATRRWFSNTRTPAPGSTTASC